MNTDQEDIILIQGVIVNNTESQNKLYDKYTKYVKNFLRKNYTAYYDLDDDVSEIMIKIFTGIKSFDIKKSSFTSWVCTIAKNHMIDKWRANDISYMLTTNTSGNYITSSLTYSDNTSNMDNNFVINSSGTNTFTTSSYSASCEYEISNTTSFITSQLSSCDCAFLEMKYIYGYDYCEIGNEFNISSTTVSNRVNYIKNKLKIYEAEVID